MACGTDIILKKRAEAKGETLLSRRQLKEDLVVRENKFTAPFPTYKPFFNEMWGKLYRTTLFSEKHNRRYFYQKFFRRFLPDTLFTVDNLSSSRAIGILSGTSHKFYQYGQRRVSNATVMMNEFAAKHQPLLPFRKRNQFSVYNTYQAVMDFLCDHGEISAEVYEYMQAVLFGWFGDFYSRTLLMTQNEARFADHAARLALHRKFDEVMYYQDSGRYNNLRNYEERLDFFWLLSNTLLFQKEIRNTVIPLLGRDAYGTSATGRTIDRVILKLDNTIQVLSAI